MQEELRMPKEKKVKQKIEDVISDLHDYDIKANALRFVAWLRENKMNPINASKNGWKISSKACVVCYIWLNSDTGALTIVPFIGEYEHDSLSDDLKEIVWSNHKGACGECAVISGRHNCSYKINTIFGKDYDNACARSIAFINPSPSEIECIKKLLEMRKNTIKNGKLLPTSPTNYGQNN